METALRYELITNIPELTNNIYPTNAPEGHTRPYLVYTRINTDKIKTLKGYTDKEALSYMFSVMATRYADMVSIRKDVEDFIEGMIGKTIGDPEKQQFEVGDITINNITDVYEHELKVNRGIIDFTIYF